MQRTHNVMTVRTEAFSDTPRSKTHLEWISSDKANSDEAHEDISAAAHRQRTAERYPTVEASPGKRTSTTIPMGGRKATHHFGVHSRALGDGAVDDHRACSVSYGCHFVEVGRKVWLCRRVGEKDGRSERYRAKTGGEANGRNVVFEDEKGEEVEDDKCEDGRKKRKTLITLISS